MSTVASDGVPGRLAKVLALLSVGFFGCFPFPR